MNNAIHHMKNFTALVFVVMVLTIILGCNPQPDQNIQQPPLEIRMGYCPTMEPYVQSLAEAHQYVIPVLYDNSAAAMQALQTGTVQAILIGRTAWSHELTADLRLLLMADGLTLIVQQPGFIRYEDVPKIRILTHEDPAAVQSLIPIQTNVVFYEDFEQMISDMDASAAVLLRWSQVSPMDNLLIPVDPSGLKTPGFRSPHLYYMAPMEETLSPLLTTLATNP
jgi:hypothetical protein